MKRDFDLVRAILLEAEAQDEPSRFGPMLGHSQISVSYHVAIMIKGGLLDGFVSRSASEQFGSVHPLGLTWEGHDFLDALRDDTVYNKVKRAIGDQVMSAPFEVWKALAIQYGLGLIGGAE